MHPNYQAVTELCYVTADLESAVAHWVNLVGAGPFFTGEVQLDYESGGARRAVPAAVALGASGRVIIEIIAPRAGVESIFSAALESGRQRLHALGVRPGVRHAETEARAPERAVAATVHQSGGARRDYYRQGAGMPFMVRSLVPGGSADGMAAALIAAHRGWNGEDPARQLSRLHQNAVNP